MLSTNAYIHVMFQFQVNLLTLNQMSQTTENTQVRVAKFSLSCASAGMLISLFTFPMEKINIRMKLKITPDRSIFTAVRDLIRVEKIQGAYRGISVSLWMTFVGFTLNNFVYENLNLVWKRVQKLRTSPFYAFSPGINMLLAGIVPAIINAVPSIVLQKIHENRFPAGQAWRQALSISRHEFWKYCRTIYIGVMLFLTTRQFIYEHSIKFFRERMKLQNIQSNLLSSALSVLVANAVYQPMEVIIAHIAIGHKNIIQHMKSSRSGLFKSLWKGANARLIISFSFNFAFMPIYSFLKSTYNLFAYI